MNPKLKLLALLTVSTLSLLTANPLHMLLLLSAVAAVMLLSRIPLRDIFGWVKFILAVAIFVLLLQAFTHTGLGFTLAGFALGTTTALRLLTLTLAVFTFVYTTMPREISRALSFLPGKIPFMLAMSLGMLPSIKNDVNAIKNAQQSRGWGFAWNPVKTYTPVLIPLFGKTLERSNKLALSMESRGFDPNH